MKLHYVAEMVAIGLMVLASGVVSGQNYPSRPIRIFASEAGGGTDLAARLIAPGLTAGLGQSIVIENRNALIATETVAKSPPDGYALLLNGPAVWLTQFMRDNVTWDPLRDLAPITLAVSSPSVLVVHPSLPVKSVRELIALAKARPGELNYGTGPAGGPPHLAGELFKAMAGVNIVVIPYRGTGPALNALIGGQVQLMFPSAGGALQHVRSGRLRALAITSARPSTLIPGLPTVATGLPGYESIGIFGVFAPANTPGAIINRLNQEIVRALNQADVKEKFLNAGTETVGSTPEQLTAAIKAEMATMGKVIRDNGIHE